MMPFMGEARGIENMKDTMRGMQKINVNKNIVNGNGHTKT